MIKRGHPEMLHTPTTIRDLDCFRLQSFLPGFKTSLRGPQGQQRNLRFLKEFKAWTAGSLWLTVWCFIMFHIESSDQLVLAGKWNQEKSKLCCMLRRWRMLPSTWQRLVKKERRTWVDYEPNGRFCPHMSSLWIFPNSGLVRSILQATSMQQANDAQKISLWACFGLLSQC